MASERTATLVRMVLLDHECPFGVRAKALLEAHGYIIEERVLRSREEVDAYEAEQGVDTTPQISIDGQRIGGCDDLESFLAAPGRSDEPHGAGEEIIPDGNGPSF